MPAVAVVAALLLTGVVVSGQPAQQREAQARDEILRQEGTYITFYAHPFDVGRDVPMPMNTQFPDGEDDLSRGYGGACGPDPSGEGVSTCDDYALNEHYFYTTAGFVQVKNADEFSAVGYGAFHNERGQTKDIFIDTSKPIATTYYMSADWHGWLVLFGEAGMAWNWDPGVFKDWVVESRVWHGSLGDQHSAASEAPDMTGVAARDAAFTLVAEGRVGPQDIMSFGPNVPAVGDQTVWPFDAELAYSDEFLASGGIIPSTDDLIWEVEFFQETEGERYIASEGTVTWNVNSGEDYPLNMQLPVRNPMDVELVYPRFVHNQLVVLGVINTPWGSYDIDHQATRLVIRDAKGAEVPFLDAHVESDLDVSVAHAGHYQPITATWILDYQAQGLAAGDYTATVETQNFQGSYKTSTTAAFTIEDAGGGQGQAGRSGLRSGGPSDAQLAPSTAPPAQPATDAQPIAEGESSPGFSIAGALLVLAVSLLAFLRRRHA